MGMKAGSRCTYINIYISIYTSAINLYSLPNCDVPEEGWVKVGMGSKDADRLDRRSHN
jgi:hypothetical protein